MVPNCLFRRTCVKKVPKSLNMRCFRQKGVQTVKHSFFSSNMCQKDARIVKTALFVVKKMPKRPQIRVFRRKCIKKVPKSSKMCFFSSKRCHNVQKCFFFRQTCVKQLPKSSNMRFFTILMISGPSRPQTWIRLKILR